ncbi:hypothetical protein D9M72_508900 [compost metagenome]
MSLASAITCSAVSKRMMGAIGPKVSSWATRMSVEMPVRTVGSKKVPDAPIRWPPARTLAPLETASVTWASIFSIACLSIIGPMVMPGVKPSPTVSSATRLTNFSAKASWTPDCT